MTEAVHFAAEDTRYLTPEDELEEIELGDRVSLHCLMVDLARRYTPPIFSLSCFSPWGAKHDSETSPWMAEGAS